MLERNKPIPNFVYVGAPKSGSTWLFEAFRAHPDIYVYPGKSTKHFETDEPGSIDHYLSYFENAQGARAIGEIAHDIYLYSGSAARLYEAFPNMKVLVCLREPGDFARSVLKWLQAHTEAMGRTAEEITTNERYKNLLAYNRNIARFYKAYPAKNILVLFYEDLKHDPRAFLTQALCFLNVDPNILPSNIEKVVNPSRAARFIQLNHLLYRAGVSVRALGGGRLIESLKTSRALETLLYSELKAKDDDGADVLAAMRAARNTARTDFEALERMIGRPLPMEWWERLSDDV